MDNDTPGHIVDDLGLSSILRDVINERPRKNDLLALHIIVSSVPHGLGADKKPAHSRIRNGDGKVVELGKYFIFKFRAGAVLFFLQGTVWVLN